MILFPYSAHVNVSSKGHEIRLVSVILEIKSPEVQVKLFNSVFLFAVLILAPLYGVMSDTRQAKFVLVASASFFVGIVYASIVNMKDTLK